MNFIRMIDTLMGAVAFGQFGVLLPMVSVSLTVTRLKHRGLM